VKVRGALLRCPAPRAAFACALSSLLAACGGTLDAGSDHPRETLPVGPENPVILTNDGAYDNWQGEYAVLLAQADAPPLAGIVVSTGGLWSDLDSNFSAWQELVTQARASGLANLPDPIRSPSEPLQRPDDEAIESTLPNDSEGARFIVETSARLSRPDRPVVIATGGRLTDVADAYLIDSTVAERAIVVSSLGTGFADGEQVARMGVPNGEMDPWADAIVTQRFRYVQVSAYYDQLSDVPEERLPELPDNPFGEWIAAKQPKILSTPLASDQVSVLALGIPEFARAVTRVSQSGWEMDQPTLAPDPHGHGWLVSASEGAAATAHLWELLLAPETFGK
jgi:hypothetical protein